MVYVLRSKEDIDDFITVATSTTTTISDAYDRHGENDTGYRLVYGAGAGEDSNSPDHYIGTVQGKNTRDRAKARRGKRLVGRD